MFAFSSENWTRSKDEVDFLMRLIETEMPRRIETARRDGARVKFIGRRDRLSKKIVKMFEKAEKDTSENAKGTLVFAIDYGGRDEILRAANAAIGAGAPVDEETFESLMDTGDLPPIDLVVRTSGEQRISNFMLWKLAYAEMMFVPEDWPQIDAKILDRMLGDFEKRIRRFGK
jgi:undecaprenyl diphosphate synthase